MISTLRPELKKYYNLYRKKYRIIFKQQQQKRVEGTFYIILSLLTVSFFTLFAIRPTLATISNLNKQKEDSQLVLEALETKLAALQKLDGAYASLGQTATLIQDAIPSSPEIPTLTRQLEMLASTHNLSIQRLDFGTIELYPGVKKNASIFSFTFTMSLQGGTTQINAFMQDLINFNRIITLERVTTGTTGENQEALITGRTYFYKPNP